MLTPDGHQLVMKVIEAADGTSTNDLAVVPLDGGAAQLITQPDAVLQLTDQWAIRAMRISPIAKLCCGWCKVLPRKRA